MKTFHGANYSDILFFMNDIRLITLDPNEWKAYKQIRLEALKNEPDAFARTYDEERDKKDEVWKERLEEAQNNNKVVLLFVQYNNRIVGMGGLFYTHEHSPLVEIWGIYINKEFRGKGLGKVLITNLITKAKKNKKTKKLKIEVNSANIPAIRLYLRLGFNITETKKKVLHGKFDEYVMEKELTPTITSP